MTRESNLRCKCGSELLATENMNHTYYICLECDAFYAVAGTDHWFKVDEIDLKTGRIIPLKESN